MVYIGEPKVRNGYFDSGLNRRSFLAGMSVLAGSGLLAACGGSGGSTGADVAGELVKPVPDGDLNWLNWSQYVSPEVISSFEKEYGVKVNQTYFAGVDEVVTKLANKTPVDLASVSSTQIQRLAEGNALRSIDFDKLENFDQLEAFYHNPPYDPQKGHCVPYAVGGMGIAYNTDYVDVDSLTGSWADLWSGADAHPGRVFVVSDMQRSLAMSLLKLGYDANSADSGQIRQAAEALIELKPRLAGFSSDNIENATSGRAFMQQAWAGDIYNAITSGAGQAGKTKFQWCREGQLVAGDQLVIPIAARHPGTAALFMDWILRPDQSATNIAYTGYPNGTTAGNREFKKLTENYPYLYEGLAEMSNPGAWLTGLLGQRMTDYTREWTRISAS